MRAVAIFVVLSVSLVLSSCGSGSSASQPNPEPNPAPDPGQPQATFLVAMNVTPSALTADAGASQQYSATGVFSDGTTQDLTRSATWTTTNGSVAAISSTGLAAIAGPGQTVIQASSAGVTGYSLISVPIVPQGATELLPPDFYVATDGNDVWSGTLPVPNGNGTDGPFLSLDRARKAVQGMPDGKRIVQIRGGNYFLAAPLAFTAADSGTAAAPIVYENYPGETPIISGGRLVTGWANTAGNVWTVSLPSGSYLNFEGLFYNGERRYRPRTTVDSYLHNAGPVYSGTQSANCGYQVNGQWQCFDQFIYSGSDLASTYHGLALGDVEVLDFEKWTMSRMRLASVDVANHIAHLTGPTYEGGDNGFITGHRYLVENVQEALNQPGQWYLDRCANPPTCTSSTGPWTLTYLAQSGENPAAAEIVVPQQAQVLIASGLSNVVFKGLTFAHDNWMPPAAGLGDQQAMPKVTAAVSLADSQNVVFDSDTIAHTEGWGLEFVTNTGVTANNQVVNSALYDIGAGGIRIGRWPCTGPGKGTSACVTADAESRTPQNTLVQNNVVEGLGRVQPTGIGTGIWIGNAHHNIVTHNEIYDLYSGAIGIGFAFGATASSLAHDNVVDHNLLYALGQGVTSDMGGVYLSAAATTGNFVTNNVIHDVTHDVADSDGYGGNGIYFDQGTSNAVARNNLVYRVSAAGLFNNRSDNALDIYRQNNVVVNNIFAYTRQVVIQRGGDNSYSISFARNLAYFDKGTVQGGHWACQAGGGDATALPCNQKFLLDYGDYWNAAGSAPRFFTTGLNSTVPTTTYNLAGWQGLGEDVHSLNQNPLFTDPAYPADNFALTSTSPAFDLGFVSFDSTQAGRSNPVIMPPSVSPAFPLQVLNPATDF